MAYHYAPETRYMAEVYPVVIAACGVTAAAAWSYILDRAARRFPLGHGRKQYKNHEAV